MFYFLDFERTLYIISNSGFKYIEVCGFWQDREWIVGQHLEGYSLKKILDLARKYNLVISSFHDMSGAMYSYRDDVIDKFTREYVLESDIYCIVTHIPYILKRDFMNLSKYIKNVNDKYFDMSSKYNKLICVENMSEIDDYDVLFNNCDEITKFCNENKVFLNVDLVHIIESGYNVRNFLKKMKSCIKSFHVSGYSYECGRTNFKKDNFGVLKILSDYNWDDIYSFTIETKIETTDADNQYYINYCKELRKDLENIIYEKRS